MTGCVPRSSERIMCDFGVDLAPVCARHGSLPEAMLKSSPRLQNLISDGVVELDGTSLALARDLRFLVRSVAAASTPIWTDRSSCIAGRFRRSLVGQDEIMPSQIRCRSLRGTNSFRAAALSFNLEWRRACPLD
jgi:hypothetical protein